MLSRRVAPVLLALLLAGLAVSSPRLGRAGAPDGGEVTTILAGLSLAEDHDLRFAAADLGRGDRLWAEGPVGVRLAQRPGEDIVRFVVPVAAALTAAPWVAALGAAGLPLLNALLLAIVAGWASRLRPESSLAWLFFLGSGALALALRADASVLAMTLVFAALALATERRWAEDASAADRQWLLALGGALAAIAVSLSPIAAWAGVFLVADLAGRRRWRGLAALALGAVLAAGGLAVVQHRLTGYWSPASAPAVVWSGPFPGEAGAGSGRPLATEPWRLEARPTWVGRALFYRLLGRHAGLIAYFPLAALALVLGWRGADRRGRLLLGTLVLALAGGALGRGGAPTLPAYAALLPLLPLAFLALPQRVGPRSAALAVLALGVWTLPAVAATWAATGSDVASVASLPTFQALPLELTGLGDGEAQPELVRHAWGEVVWLVPRATFFVEERHPHGVWVRGGSRSEIILASPRPLPRLALRVYSLASPNPVTLESPAGSVRVPFASEGERATGVDVDLPLRPAARDLGVVLSPPQPEWLYRVVLRVAGGTVLRRQRPRGDARDLGVFLSVDGQPP